jgi:hypothetical protein
MRVVFAVCLFSLVVLTGCPSTGVVCRAGTDPCGSGCIDKSSDKRNCGGCGIACGASQQCNAGNCECEAGTSLCNGECVVTDYDTANCGTCGKACASGGTCTLGVCGCPAGLTTCSSACVATANDVKNCGLCGKACATGEVCDQGACKVSCTSPAVACGTACATLATDRLNCGMCGKTCLATESCVAGQCACPAGQTACAGACVDTSTSTTHCGQCGQGCSGGQSCRAGVCTFDVVAACYWSGQAVGFNATTFAKGTLSDLGTNPAALAVKAGVLLAADGMDQRVYQAVLSPSGLAQASRANATGAVPNQVLVDGANVYVVNATSGTLQVLVDGADAGRVTVAGVDGGLGMGTVSELNFGMNSYPQGVARVGDAVWVPLYGGYGAAAADAGQVVVRVAVANPGVEVARVSLKSLDLKAFDGGTPGVARPWAITSHRGAVYVVLNNLNPDTYAPEGPGLLARIDPATNAVSAIDLGAARCLNPQWAASVGDALAVSCGGLVSYTPTYTVDSVRAAGLVLLNAQDQVSASWSSACPVDAGTCAPMMPGRFTVRGARVLLGDQNAGRVVVLDVADGGLTEVRGVTNALSTCPISAATGAGNVSDLVSLP